MKRYLVFGALIAACLLLAGCHDDGTGPEESTPTPTATAIPSTPAPTLTPTPCPGSGVTIDGWERLGDCNIRIHGRCWGIGCNNLKLGFFIAPTEPNVHQWFFQGYAVINEADGTWWAIGHLGPDATQCVRESIAWRPCPWPRIVPSAIPDRKIWRAIRAAKGRRFTGPMSGIEYSESKSP